MKVVIVSLLFACFAGSDSRAAPEATVSTGRLQGKWLRSRSGRTIAAFQNIPFAAPPVGDLRFRGPQLPLPWQGVRQATAFGPICTQRTSADLPDVAGQEDCLTINVYAPRASNHVDVLVFIYGGAYLLGSADTYQPDFLLDKDVVFVTFNYRVGSLGFLTTGDNIIPGNLGLKDQVRALQWVKTNIKAFGGNPNSVTIYGQSAGASSAHLLTLSPLAKGLFHKAIIQSGSALCPWTFSQPGEARQIAAQIAGVLGCPAEPSAAMRDCLLGLPDTSIQGADYNLFGWGRLSVSLVTPMAEPAGTEGAFITRHPEEILATSGPVSDVPIIIGFDAQDGGLWVEDAIKNQTDYEYFDQHFESLVTTMLNMQRSPKKVIEPSLKQLRKFYYGNDSLSNDKKANTNDLFTDTLFLWPAVRSIKLLFKHATSPIYFLDFDHLSAAATDDGFGVGHIAYLYYIFPFVGSAGLKTEGDVKVSKSMIQHIFNFVSKGSPTVDGSWSRVTRPEAAEYFLIASADDMRTHSNPATERMQMWKQLPKPIGEASEPPSEEAGFRHPSLIFRR